MCLSSTVDKMISARAAEIEPNHTKRVFFENVLSYSGRSELLPTESFVADVEELHVEDAIDEDDTSIASDSSELVPDLGEEENEHAEEEEGSLSTCTKIFEIHEWKFPSTPKKKREYLLKWVDAPSKLHRQYLFCNKSQLTAHLKRVSSDVSRTGNKETIFNRLIGEEKKKQERARRLIADEEAFQDDEVDPVLMQVFRASYMKPLKGGAK